MPVSRANTVDQDLETLSRLMDSAFEIPGLRWRFGLDALIGLIPGIGEIVAGGVSFYIIALAALRYRLAGITLIRMGLNLILDVAIGSIPIVGDLFDVWWKVNERNMELIRRRTASANDRGRSAWWDWAFVLVVLGVVLAVVVGALILLWSVLVSLISGIGR
jgi:hypothetical protein